MNFLQKFGHTEADQLVSSVFGGLEREKKKSSERKFKSSREMDRYLESTDLADLFEKHGKVQKPSIKKVNLDLPEWLLFALDFEADRAGIARQPLIKLWLVQKLEEERRRRISG